LISGGDLLVRGFDLVNIANMRSLKSTLLRIFAVIISAAIAFEALSALVIMTKVIPANAPSYVLPTFKPFWTVENPHFGVWHAPNAKHVHVTACYALTYKSNSYGARDREHPVDSDKSRTIVLGDSFVEGFGLATDDRLTERLEAETGVSYLNFGSSGGFGPTQYLQVYRNLAKSFSHDQVIIGLLPDNDFLDNDPAHARIHNDKNYKPVFVKDGDSYTLKILNKDALGTAEKDKRRALRTGLRNFLRNFTFSAHAIDYFKAMSNIWFSESDINANSARRYSGFYDAKPEQIRRVAFALKTLASEAAPRPVRILLIPRLSDIHAFQQYGASPLASTFSDIAEVLDLLPIFAAHPDPESLFNECDGHWSAEGVKIAVDQLH
jgi:hypothetical protein